MKKTIFICMFLFGCSGAKIDKAAKVSFDKDAVMGRIDEGSRCETEGDDIREVLVDLNQDDIFDVRKVFKKTSDGEVLMCREADLNLDGTKDIFVFFDMDELISRDEVDLDYDGKIDVITTYAKGKVVKQELDTNSDGMIDRIRYMEDGLPRRLEGDTDGNNKVDYWEYYEAGKLIRVGIDIDGDGRADKWLRDDRPEEPEESEEPDTESESSDTDTENMSEDDE